MNYANNYLVYAADATISQYPDNPKEGEEVKLKLESDKYDLNVANVTWLIDNQEVDNGGFGDGFTELRHDNGNGGHGSSE